MKSSPRRFRNVVGLGLTLGILLGAVLTSRAQYNAIVDPFQNWIGYINYYNGPSYLGGSNTALANLRAYFIPNQVTATRLLLRLNTNSYPTLPGGYTVEADTYVDTGTAHVGQTVTFSGMVESNSIPGPWEIYAFIKEFAPGYASVVQIVTQPLVTGTPFNLSLPNPVSAGGISQYGFYTYGASAQPNSSDAAQTASIIISNPPSTTVHVSVDPALSWGAALNYYSTSDSYLGYAPYTLAQNPAVFVPDQANATRLVLGINTDTYAPGSAWNAGDGTPLRRLETDTYVDPGTAYSGDTVIFSGTVESNTLPAGWTAYAFIKEYTAGYASFLTTAQVVLPASGPFNVGRSVALGDGIQYGFYVYGPNTAPASPNAQKHVSIVIGSGTTINPFSVTATRSGNTLTLYFPTQNGVNYTVQYKNALSDANWQTLTVVNGNGSIASPTDAVGSGARIYRVNAQ